MNIHEDTNTKDLFKNLKIDCKNCLGFCCVALYFSASEGFPTDKESGKPCINLKSDFSCSIHKELRKKGLKGCTAYDCFGAGQKVAQVTYKGIDWRQSDDLAKEMFEVFLVMRKLHEMLWYLTEASILKPANTIKNELDLMIMEIYELTNLPPKSILSLDIDSLRTKVNSLLRQASEFVKLRVCQDKKLCSNNKKKLKSGYDFIGANLTKTNLIGANLAGALLIAANLKGADLTGSNLIGVDMRDTNIMDADLSNSIFITQSQINAAKGNFNTKLPTALIRPEYWEK